MAIISKLLTTALVFASIANAVPAIGGTTRYKANEYRSGDCSGPINYQHVSATLDSVTMDDSSHSVYLASPYHEWVGYEGKSRNGGHCIGQSLGRLPDRCVNLDTAMGKRVRCVHIE